MKNSLRRFKIRLFLELSLQIVGAILLLFLIDFVSEKTGQEASAWIYASPLLLRWSLCLVLIVSIFVFGMYGPGFDASNFIYVDF